MLEDDGAAPRDETEVTKPDPPKEADPPKPTP